MAQALPETKTVETATELQAQAAASPAAKDPFVELKNLKSRVEFVERKPKPETVLTEVTTTTATASARAESNVSPAGNVSEAHPTAPVRKAVEDAIQVMRRMGSDSVALVLQPDHETRLSLHIKMQDGRFEAIAILEQGNYSQLGADWEQLQRRLADQGVRLAPLVPNLNQTPSFAGSFSSARGHRETEQQEDAPQLNLSAPRRFRVDGKTATRTRAREWWA